jgi:hypothetical protein
VGWRLWFILLPLLFLLILALRACMPHACWLKWCFFLCLLVGPHALGQGPQFMGPHGSFSFVFMESILCKWFCCSVLLCLVILGTCRLGFLK